MHTRSTLLSVTFMFSKFIETSVYKQRLCATSSGDLSFISNLLALRSHASTASHYWIQTGRRAGRFIGYQIVLLWFTNWFSLTVRAIISELGLQLLVRLDRRLIAKHISETLTLYRVVNIAQYFKSKWANVLLHLPIISEGRGGGDANNILKKVSDHNLCFSVYWIMKALDDVTFMVYAIATSTLKERISCDLKHAPSEVLDYLSRL